MGEYYAQAEEDEEGCCAGPSVDDEGGGFVEVGLVDLGVSVSMRCSVIFLANGCACIAPLWRAVLNGIGSTDSLYLGRLRRDGRKGRVGLRAVHSRARSLIIGLRFSGTVNVGSASGEEGMANGEVGARR